MKKIILILFVLVLAGFFVSAGDYKFQDSSGNDLAVINGSSGNFTISGWFKGLFNWTAIGDFLSFDGSTLTFNDSYLNSTIESIDSATNTSMRNYVDGTFVELAGDTMTGNLNMGENDIFNATWINSTNGYFSGNVGIGTDSPGSILEIKENVAAGAGAELRIINDGSASAIGQSASITLGRNYNERNWKIISNSTGSYGSNPDLIFTVNNGTDDFHKEVFRLTNDGNAEISDDLTVGGDTEISGSLDVAHLTGLASPHPENADFFTLPYYENDLAFLTLKGYSVTKTETGVSCGTDYEDLFDAEAAFWSCTGTGDAGDEATLEIELDKVYYAQSNIGFDSRTFSRAKDFTLEVHNYTEDKWYLIDTQTDYAYGSYIVSHNPGGQGIDKIRFNFSNFAYTYFRVSEIFLNNYLGEMGTNYFVTRAGGSIYGNLDLGENQIYNATWINSTNGYFSGNVGIGTDSPSYKLDVNGIVNAYNYLINGSSIASEISGEVNSTSWNRSGTNVYLANSGDNVGIGTSSPDEKLNLYGITGGTFLKIHDARSSTGDLAGIKLGTRAVGQTPSMKTMITHIETGSYGIGDLVFAVNNFGNDTEVSIADERMRITSDGNVGIGTDSPDAKLEVTGDVIIDLSD